MEPRPARGLRLWWRSWTSCPGRLASRCGCHSRQHRGCSSYPLRGHRRRVWQSQTSSPAHPVSGAGYWDTPPRHRSYPPYPPRRPWDARPGRERSLRWQTGTSSPAHPASRAGHCYTSLRRRGGPRYPPPGRRHLARQSPTSFPARPASGSGDCHRPRRRHKGRRPRPRRQPQGGSLRRASAGGK